MALNLIDSTDIKVTQHDNNIKLNIVPEYVVDNLNGEDVNKAPSVRSTKEYISNEILEDYTEEEQVIGTYLGKPLYRKTVNIGVLPSVEEADVLYETGLSNAICINLYGMAFRNDGTRQFPLPYSGNSFISLWFYSSEQKINVNCKNSRADYNGHITIEYTKTTDVDVLSDK